MKTYYVRNIADDKTMIVKSNGPQYAIRDLLSKYDLDIRLGTREQHNFEVYIASPVARHVMNYYIVSVKRSMQEKFVAEIWEIAERMMRERDYLKTDYVLLGEDNKGRDWGIVIGWRRCYTNNPKMYSSNNFELVGKLAYLSRNTESLDYIKDWIMPLDKKTGKVYNTELDIYSYDALFDSVSLWLESYEKFRKRYQIVNVY